MSVVIIGGNERMEQQYKEICKRYRCKAGIYPDDVREPEDPDRTAGSDHLVYFYGGARWSLRLREA